MLNPKSLAAYSALGGIEGLERGLRTDLFAGLSLDETELQGHASFYEATAVEHKKTMEVEAIAPGGASSASSEEESDRYSSRVRVYKDNRLPEKKATSLWKLMWLAYNDKILILLTVAAVISLALGLYETLGQKPAPGEAPSVDWVEGVAICVAIVIVVMVGSFNDWQKEKQFLQLNKKVCALSSSSVF